MGTVERRKLSEPPLPKRKFAYPRGKHPRVKKPLTFEPPTNPVHRASLIRRLCEEVAPL